MVVDARGYSCPMPGVMVQKAVKADSPAAMEVLVGWGSVLLGGCPLRQLILAGEGNGDSAVTVFGMIVGAAFAHNFGLAGSADAMNEAKEIVVGGISTNGKIAVCLGIVIMLAVSLWNMPKRAAVNAAAVK